MNNQEILKNLLLQLPFVKYVTFGPVPADKAALHAEPALELSCYFTEFMPGPKASLYLAESFINNPDNHTAIVENITNAYQSMTKIP